ncbi:hypothetical protein [Variovorax sp. LjRoot178]|uniref:hypothetical protein n=1 Tax=Variovorax sp. LjRoot178 TaxID=3342277 RepID=UPI003ECFFCF8
MSNPFNPEQAAEAMSIQATERREFLRNAGASAAALGLMSITGTAAFAANMRANPDMSNGANNFYKSDKVTLQKVTFKDQYQMSVAGNLFVPKAFDRSKAHPALVVSHPMGP